MSAPAYNSAPFKGMDDHPPSYNAIQPPGPGPMNFPLQPQGLPLAQQTAIMPYVAQIPGVPPGLEYLTQIDQVVIQEKFSSAQRWGRSYEILNTLNQRIFFAKQEVKCCCPLYNLHVLDNNNKEVIQFLLNCQCACCSSELEIHCPPGNIIGYSVWKYSNFVTSLYIQNEAKQTALVTVGPDFQTSIFGDVVFEVKSNDETQTVGLIRRNGGLFSVQFPLDLDVKLKAVLIGSCFFLDHMIYTRRQQVLQAQSSSD
ncbi:phospholipid scramblase 1-like [Lissotriton helveticus]